MTLTLLSMITNNLLDIFQKWMIENYKITRYFLILNLKNIIIRFNVIISFFQSKIALFFENHIMDNKIVTPWRRILRR